MKLTVFGSTGQTGREVVAEALAQGHEVTAFARTPARLNITHPNLRVVQGDILSPATVERAVVGQDAVICTLGMPLSNADMVRTTGTRHIIRAMQNTGVKRLVCQSSLGVGDSRAGLPVHYRWFILPVVLRRVLADHEAQEQLIGESGLEWIIVRPGNLTNGARTGAYRTSVTPQSEPIKIKVSRADVAQFMVRQTNDDTYLHQTPLMSY